MEFLILSVLLLFNEVFSIVVDEQKEWNISLLNVNMSSIPIKTLMRRRRLTGGIETQPKEVSMVGSLQRKADRKHFCGVTLITLKHGITGCSCVVMGLPTEAGLLEISKFIVVAGEKRWDTKRHSRIRDVQSFQKHDKCQIDEETGIWKFGLGYFELSTPFPDWGGPDYAPGMPKTQEEYEVALKSFYDNDEYAQGSRTKYCYTYGWGAKKYDLKTGEPWLFPFYLNKRAMQFIELKDCQDRLCSNGFCSFKIDQAGAICLGVPDNKDGAICKGDAGNPLMCGNKFFGVAEEMPDCGMNLKFAIFYKLDISVIQGIKSGVATCPFSHRTRTQWILISLALIGYVTV